MGLPAHKAPLRARDELPTLHYMGVCLHDLEATLGFNLPRLQSNCGANCQARAIANLHSRRHHHLPLQKMIIGHDIVEQAEDDAAMRHTVVAAVFFGGCEFGAANLALAIGLKAELDFESDWVVRTANETMIGWRI